MVVGEKDRRGEYELNEAIQIGGERKVFFLVVRS